MLRRGATRLELRVADAMEEFEEVQRERTREAAQTAGGDNTASGSAGRRAFFFFFCSVAAAACPVEGVIYTPPPQSPLFV